MNELSHDQAVQGLQHGAALAALVNSFLNGTGADRGQLRLALQRYDRWAVGAGVLDPELVRS